MCTRIHGLFLILFSSTQWMRQDRALMMLLSDLTLMKQYTVAGPNDQPSCSRANSCPGSPTADLVSCPCHQIHGLTGLQRGYLSDTPPILATRAASVSLVWCLVCLTIVQLVCNAMFTRLGCKF